jgi:flagellar protein FlbT
MEIINNHILTGEFYKALKRARRLITYEQELMDNESSGTGLRKSR